MDKVGEEEGEGKMYGKSNIEIYNTMCKAKLMGICCMAQGTQTGSVTGWRVGWEGWWEAGLGRRGHEDTYGWFLLIYDRKPQNSLKQLSVS